MITKGTKNSVYQAITAAAANDPMGIYAMECQRPPDEKQVCTAYQSTSTDVKDAVSAAEGRPDAEEWAFLVGAAQPTDVARLDGFIPFIDKQVLLGKLCYGEVLLREENTIKQLRVYGPGDTFRNEITQGKANFLSAAVPATFQSRSPDAVVDWVFKELKNQLLDAERDNPQRLSIIVFPEFFFNRIYRTDTRGVLDDKLVGGILKKYRDVFGGKCNVICSLSFFHLFDSKRTPEWLGYWEKPAWWRKGHARSTFADLGNEKQTSKAVFGNPNSRLANYQLFLCNGMELGVYRKGCYVKEMYLGAELAGLQILKKGRMELKLKSRYEFGNWKTTIVAKEMIYVDIATKLFGDDGVIVPRICGDLHFMQALKLAIRDQELVDYFDMNRPQQGSLLLISGAGVPHVKDVVELAQSTNIAVRIVDCNMGNHQIVVSDKKGEETAEAKPAETKEDMGAGGNQDGNVSLVFHSKRNRCKDLKAALYHLTRFISRRCRASCQHVSQLDDLVGKFSRSKRNHKRNRCKDLKAALYHLTRFIHGHHTRETVNCCKSAMLLRPGKEKHHHTGN